MMCSKCGKNVAVVFLTKVENGVTKNEGLCMTCAKKLGINSINNIIEKMGISEEEFDEMNRGVMESLGDMDGSGEITPDMLSGIMPMMQNAFGNFADEKSDFNDELPKTTKTKVDEKKKKKSIIEQYGTANVIGAGTAVALNASNIYENIVKLRLLLDKNNVPNEGRTLVIPPEAYALLLQDQRFTSGGGAMGEEALRSGYIGSVAGFEIYESNNCVKSGSAYTITAQVKSACTYAEQIVETGAYRPEKRFADAVKGLHVYGAKVTDGKQIAALKCTF